MSLLLIIMLIVASIAALGSPSNKILRSSDSKNGFQSNIYRSDRNLSKIELLQIAAKRGRERMKIMVDYAKIMGRRVESSSHDDVSVASRVYQSAGEFFITLSIGTPKPSPFTAMIDTGSDLVSTQCQPCKRCQNQSTPIFNPGKSFSYSKLNCTSNMCKVLPSSRSKCGKHGECSYVYVYEDNSYTRGVLATETFTFEGNVKVPKLAFGCAFDNEGEFGTNLGMVGLGRGNLSLVSQMKETKFSYCLPTYGSNETGLLSMGFLAAAPRCAKTTPLVQNQFMSTYYYLSLQGITIGTIKLKIDKTKFEIKGNGTGGFIIDTGTTLTYLEKSSFDQVGNELTRQLKLPSFNGTSVQSDLEVCYKLTRPKNKINFPNIIFHFQGKGDFEVRPDNYFISSDDGAVGCLVMGSSFFSDGTSILGNYQQQNALLVYDLAENKLSFITNTKCT